MMGSSTRRARRAAPLLAALLSACGAQSAGAPPESPATGKPTEFQKISDRVWEASFEIAVKNAKTTPITATVVEQFPADWRILQESLPHQKTDARTATWSVAVPAMGETKLSYRVRVTY